MKVLSKVMPKVSKGVGVEGLLGYGGATDTYETLGQIYNANLDTEYVSRKVAPEGFTGAITVTSGNGQVSKNGDGNWVVAVNLSGGDYYQARATSSSEYEISIVVVVDLPDTFIITTKAQDITPNPFTFTDQTDVEPSTLTTSFPVVIEGMDDGCPVSITNGEYDINQSDTWTADAGTINSGDLIRVRRQSGDFDDTVQATFHAGTTDGHFIVHTRSARTAPDPFSIPSKANVDLDIQVSSDVVSPTGLEVDAPITVTNGWYQLNGVGGFVNTQGTFSPGDTFEAAVQSSIDYGSGSICLIDIGGESSDFAVTTTTDPGVEYCLDPNGELMVDPDGNLVPCW